MKAYWEAKKRNQQQTNQEDDIHRDWKTLEETLFELFEAGKLKHPTIKTLVRIYGKEKIRSMYEQWKETKK